MSQQSEVDPPTDPFAPYEPTADDPWDVRKAAHLLRRITFGSTSERLEMVLKCPSPQAAIDSLLDFDAQSDPFEQIAEQTEGLVALDSTEGVQRWWIYRMLYSPQPAQEKIALFWHNRFATSTTKVQPQSLANQIELFRRNGLGSFRDLVVAVGRDPAMLVWLDGQSSRKGKPNENYGRELMELFTLGVGNYTEKDVQQVARAFTGWQIRENKGYFEPKQFDDGEKEIFGQKGKYDSESAVDLILQQSAAPKFLARKLLREFVHPHPTDEMVDYYGCALVNNAWQIKPVLKQMLGSRLFFSEWAYRSKIKSPAEIAIGGARAVGGKINVEFVRNSMNRMGQTLLMPPNVKGWDGEEAWINANTVLVRFNYGMFLAQQREFAKRTDIETHLKSLGLETSDAIADYYVRLLLDGRIEHSARGEFLDYMARGEKGDVRIFRLNPSTVNTKVRGVIHLIMATPEFQLA